VTNPLFLAGVVIVAGFVGTRYWQPGSSLAYFVVQLAGFVTVTGLLLAGGVVPYRPGVVGSERMRLFVSGLEIIWWLGAAWLTVGFLRAFVVLGRQPRESNWFKTYWPAWSTLLQLSQSSPMSSTCR
jgi:hypothetical protein